MSVGVKSTKQSFVILTKCLNSFPKLSASAFDAIERAFYEQMNENEDVGIENVLASLNDASLPKCSHVIQILKARERWLKEKFQNKPIVMSWSIPEIQMPEYKDIESFFHSEEKQMDYQFKRKSSLQKFVRHFNFLPKINSPIVVDLKEKSSVELVISKIAIFENNKDDFEQYEQELKEILKFMNINSLKLEKIVTDNVEFSLEYCINFLYSNREAIFNKYIISELIGYYSLEDVYSDNSDKCICLSV